MPDIDTDFCYVKRDKVLEYVVRRYGQEHWHKSSPMVPYKLVLQFVTLVERWV